MRALGCGLAVFAAAAAGCQAGQPQGETLCAPCGSTASRELRPPPATAGRWAKATPSVWDVIDEPDAYAGRQIELEGVLVDMEGTRFLLHDVAEAKLVLRRLSDGHLLPRGGCFLTVSPAMSFVAPMLREANGREVRLVGKISNLSPAAAGRDVEMKVSEVHR